jgi:hypothetical protein
MAEKLVDGVGCARHIRKGGSCRITQERSDMKSRPKQRPPAEAVPDAEGDLQPVSELDAKGVSVALARFVHPSDLKRAVRKLTKADSLRPIRPTSQVCHGKSILEMLWEELDTIVERLMGGGEAEHDIGRAQGVAYAIAVIENPYYVDIERVRKEAMDRWEQQNEEGE